MIQTPRVIIAGVNSGCGKTTVATGLMGALSRRKKVQGFKVGPDFIDPSYHTTVTGRKSRNLDAWMLSSRRILELFNRNSTDAEIAIIEGVMGLYDGLSGTDGRGSTAEMAKLIHAPVILVLDAWGMARSAAAIVAGCKILDERVDIAGVILNRVAGEKHAEMCRKAIESATNVAVVGALPRNQEMALPERHLGLVPAPERPETAGRLQKISQFVEENIDIEKVVGIAEAAPPIPLSVKESRRKKRVSIGVAYDEAFNFYYQDALDTLSSLGAELRYFSPLHDRGLPDGISGAYMGGGFPEVLSKQLEENGEMRKSMKKAAEEGMPIFAECGGLMYLTRSIRDLDGFSSKMIGVLDCETEMSKRLVLNYTDATAMEDSILSEPGMKVRGHEFHFSRLTGIPSDARFVYDLRRGNGINERKDGWSQYAILAQYMHLHFSGAKKSAMKFIEACSKYGSS